VSTEAGCPLCDGGTEQVLWRDGSCRVILAGDADYPAFCRVVWNAHVREMTDLTTEERAHLLEVVFTVERALRGILHPAKINLASFGNQVPHLHWHVVPRFADDAHFPEPVWGTRQRDGVPRPIDRPRLTHRLKQLLDR
jgi:diadenosine tetraphosphate (Ap4A) HIT family hydrolase